MSTQAATSVTALSPINLGNGNSALITPWPEFVQVQVYENAKAASDEYLREAKYSYEEYETLRQQNPHVKLPELKKPPASTKNPNSGPAGRLPPIAVSLTPNVRLARIYTMPVRPVEPPANQPKDVAEQAQHAAGVAVGAAQAVGGGVLAAATVMSDSILQIGDLLTAGYYRDSGLVQSALQRQNSLGGAIERAARHPIDTAAGVLNDLEAKRQQAEALRAAGDFYEAGKVSGTILADAYPGGGAAAGMVKKLPERHPPLKHGSDGVVILKKPPSWDIPPSVRAKIPRSWGDSKANKKGVGERWQDPDDKGNGVRIDQGDPMNSQPTQQIDHVVVRSGGRVIGRDGTPITGSIDQNFDNAHIPLSEYSKWPRWNSPK
ncbi:hypothetical protein GCM10027276_28380 [Comamonas piscis]